MPEGTSALAENLLQWQPRMQRIYVADSNFINININNDCARYKSDFNVKYIGVENESVDRNLGPFLRSFCANTLGKTTLFSPSHFYALNSNCLLLLFFYGLTTLCRLFETRKYFQILRFSGLWVCDNKKITDTIIPN